VRQGVSVSVVLVAAATAAAARGQGGPLGAAAAPVQRVVDDAPGADATATLTRRLLITRQNRLKIYNKKHKLLVKIPFKNDLKCTDCIVTYYSFFINFRNFL
jgi:hypothetical protein